MENSNLCKKNLIFNVVQFLSEELGGAELSEERKEAIEVAIQCLECAYELQNTDKDSMEKIDILAHVKAQSEGSLQEQQNNAEHYKNLGNTAMKDGKYEEAVKHYTKAIEFNSTNPIYFCNRAAAYSRLDNNEGAIKDCKQALELDPTYGKAYGRLGIAYSNLNQWAEAVRAYENSLKYDPHNTSYHTNLTLARERLFGSMGTNTGTFGAQHSHLSFPESAAPPQHRPIDISQFINNEQFVTMAREMMANPDFQNIMSGIMAMSQSGDTNFEALFQAGQDLASRMQTQNPRFVDTLRRNLDPNSPANTNAPAADPQKRERGEGSSRDSL